MFKISVFVPESHLEVVKSALFAAGAGRIGHYDSCCWQTRGMGQFRPLAGSSPWLGEQGIIEHVAEYKIELVCADQYVDGAISALRQAHPYETPAFEVSALDNRSA